MSSKKNPPAHGAEGCRILAFKTPTTCLEPVARSHATARSASAVHRAGHSVAAAVLGLDLETADRDRLDCVTARFRDSHSLTIADVQDRLTFLMSGRAAEEVVLGRVTSLAGGGPDSDLAAATRLTVRSVLEFGLEEDHGLVWSPVPDDAGLAAMLAADPRLAGLVRERLAGALMEALNLMERHKTAVERMADQLVASGPPSGWRAATP